MADIFLAYSRTDSVKALAVAERLRAEGWSVFMDVQMQIGQFWRKALLQELGTAKAVVVLWSRASVSSDYVAEEADAGKATRNLFPTLIEQVQPPYGFASIQTVDLTNWSAKAAAHPGMAKLVMELRTHITQGRVAEPFSTDAEVKPQLAIVWSRIWANRRDIAGVLGVVLVIGLLNVFGRSNDPNAQHPVDLMGLRASYQQHLVAGAAPNVLGLEVEQDNPPKIIRGTGFLVSSAGMFITAKQLVMPPGSVALDSSKIHVVFRAGDLPRKVNIIDPTNEFGVALLQVPNHPVDMPLKFATEPPNLGEELTRCGAFYAIFERVGGARQTAKQ